MENFDRATPLLDGWKIGDLISETATAKVYAATQDVGGRESVAIMKHIVVPPSETQVQALIFSGAVETEEQALYYYADVVRDLEEEIRMMHSMQDCPNILQYHGYQAIQKQDGIGFEIFLLMDFCDTLQKYMRYSAMTHLRAVNLGIDICTALEACRKVGLIHRNIKPENIFISPYDQYMLGDLGVAKTDKLHGSHVPDHLISEYSAPELSNLTGEPSETIDTYALGLVLYRIMNGNHAAFEDEQTTPATARKMIESGEQLPSPLYADYEFGEIILKASSFDPADRYQSPGEMKKALTEYFMRNNVRDELIVPPLFIPNDEDEDVAFDEEDADIIEHSVSDLSSIDEDFRSSFMPDRDLPDVQDDYNYYEEPKPEKKSRKGLVIGLSILLVFIVAAIYFANSLWPTVRIDSVEAEVAGATTVVVSWQHSQWDNSLWSLECIDAYGNKKNYTVEGDGFVISDLTPSTQYTYKVTPSAGWLRYDGDNETSATTFSETMISDLTAEPISATEANVSWTVSGTAPDEWIISYTVGGTEVSERVKGGNIKVSGLLPGSYYVFTLSTDYDTLLTGTLNTSCQTPWYTEVNDLKAVTISPTSIEVSWKVGGEEPLSWMLGYSSEAGESDSRRVVGNTWTVDGLQPNTRYEFTLVPEGDFILGGTPLVTALTESCELVSFTYELEGSYTAHLKWQVEGVSPPEWTLNYGTPGSETYTILEKGSNVTLSLFPGTEYTVELIAPEDYAMSGTEKRITFRTDDAPAFEEYGVSDQRLTFYTPSELAKFSSGEDSSSTSSFASGDSVSFVATATYEVTDRTKAVDTRYLIRDSQGAVVSSYSGTRTWDGSWTELRHSDTFNNLSLVAGVYTLEIYFDNCLLVKGNFTIS